VSRWPNDKKQALFCFGLTLCVGFDVVGVFDVGCAVGVDVGRLVDGWEVGCLEVGEVVGLEVGCREVGLDVGLEVGSCEVGAVVVGFEVGCREVGVLVGLDDGSLEVGRLVGTIPFGGAVGFG